MVVDEDKDLWDQFNVSALPTTILIDADGKVIYTHTGYKSGDETILMEKIEALMASQRLSEVDEINEQ